MRVDCKLNPQKVHPWYLNHITQNVIPLVSFEGFVGMYIVQLKKHHLPATMRWNLYLNCHIKFTILCQSWWNCALDIHYKRTIAIRFLYWNSTIPKERLKQSFDIFGKQIKPFFVDLWLTLATRMKNKSFVIIWFGCHGKGRTLFVET